MDKRPRRLIEVEVLPTPMLGMELLQNPEIGVDITPEIVPGIRGTTFIPAVSSEGIISWTNDGGLPNPEPVIIRGPQGNPTIVNGKSGEQIVLTAADVGAIAINDFDIIDCGTSTEVVG